MFHSVDHGILLTEAHALAFPQEQLYLAMQMHTDPRRLMLWGQVSGPMIPTRSVLAGCFWAIPFARVLFRSALTTVASMPDFHISAYVDDIGQDTVGPLRDIAGPSLMQSQVLRTPPIC